MNFLKQLTKTNYVQPITWNGPFIKNDTNHIVTLAQALLITKDAIENDKEQIHITTTSKWGIRTINEPYPTYSMHTDYSFQVTYEQILVAKVVIILDQSNRVYRIIIKPISDERTQVFDHLVKNILGVFYRYQRKTFIAK